MDPHTAVAKTIADRLGHNDRPLLICSTAHPAKFPSDVLTALGQKVNNDFFFGGLESIDARPKMHQELDRAMRRQCVHDRVVKPNTNVIVEELMEFVRKASWNKSQERVL